MNNSIKVALIYGSTRNGRFCDKVGQWAAGQIAANNRFSLDIIDPAAEPPQRVGSQEIGHHADKVNALSLSRRLADADAFVIVTPEYNHGYPAPLKSLIDSVGSEWQAKPVAFVSYGGASGGLRAVEQLRQVFAELHTVTIRDSVSFASAWEQFDETGALQHPERARRSMEVMLARLHWWAIALRNARAAFPYANA